MKSVRNLKPNGFIAFCIAALMLLNMFAPVVNIGVTEVFAAEAHQYETGLYKVDGEYRYYWSDPQ